MAMTLPHGLMKKAFPIWAYSNSCERGYRNKRHRCGRYRVLLFLKKAFANRTIRLSNRTNLLWGIKNCTPEGVQRKNESVFTAVEARWP